MDAELALREKLLAFSTSARYDDEVARAFEMFWGGRRQLKGARLNEADSARFIEWYIFDYETARYGKKPVELYQQFRGYTLPDAERSLLRQWQTTRFGLYEITGIWTRQVRLRDLFEKETVTVLADQGSGLSQGGLVLGRILNVGAGVKLSGTILRIPADVRDTVVQHLRDLFEQYGRGHPNARWSGFFHDWGHRVNHFLTDMQDGRCT